MFTEQYVSKAFCLRRVPARVSSDLDFPRQIIPVRVRQDDRQTPAVLEDQEQLASRTAQVAKCLRVAAHISADGAIVAVFHDPIAHVWYGDSVLIDQRTVTMAMARLCSGREMVHLE